VSVSRGAMLVEFCEMRVGLITAVAVGTITEINGREMMQNRDKRTLFLYYMEERLEVNMEMEAGNGYGELRR